MAFNLWLSAEEERILERIMRQKGARTKQQAVIKAIREIGARLDSEQPSQENPAGVVAGFPGQSTHRG
jgi:hypothetical protein